MDVVHHVVETVMNFLSIVFNSGLLYLIKTHSNSMSTMYKIMLAIDASLDLILAVVVFLGQTVTGTGGGYLQYMSNGLFSGWSYRLDLVLIFCWLWVIHLNVMWIPIQFIYRYTFICFTEL
ncbi:hypothetical protein AAVH_12483 [Aphelenchoides avenae]|nr:hypothetical protein AAVH_12483 [Aphelenchus avenae]